ncbi:MAG: helix-turn-helix domain-containing protein [Bdellovibrionaceae bacterium]|nr:helix-turn-helix domain-containing protein [Pseudobdellovibrionaceae bacterium]
MKKTGDFLKKAREDKGLSIHEIGLSLKINPKILKQIEDGDKDNLPAKTFLRGFVQSYALFLKVDPNEVLRIFSEEMGTTKPNQISLTSGPQIRGNSLEVEDPENKDDLGIKRNTGQNFTKEKFEFKNIGIGIVVFVLLISLIAVRKVVEKYQKEAEVDVAKTEENLKTNNKIELPQPPPPVTLAPANEGKPTNTDATLPADVKAPQPSLPATEAATTNTVGPTTATSPKPINNPPPQTPNAVSTNPAGQNTASPPQNPGIPNKPMAAVPTPATTTTAVAPAVKPVTTPPVATNTNKPVVQPAPSTAATTTPTPTAATLPAPKPATPPTPAVTTNPATPPVPPKPKNIELVIEAFETVEIEMTQASGKVERIKMSPSQIQSFKTVSGVKLNISNGGAVNLIVNGKDLGVPGDLGKPKRVSF